MPNSGNNFRGHPGRSGLQSCIGSYCQQWRPDSGRHRRCHRRGGGADSRDALNRMLEYEADAFAVPNVAPLWPNDLRSDGGDCYQTPTEVASMCAIAAFISTAIRRDAQTREAAHCTRPGTTPGAGRAADRLNASFSAFHESATERKRALRSRRGFRQRTSRC